MRTRVLGLLAAGLAVMCFGPWALAQADEAPQGVDPGKPVHAPGGPGAPGGPHMRMVEQYKEELIAKLQMDDEQTTAITEIFDGFAAKQQEAAQAQREKGRERAEEMRGLIEQLREAQQAGDQDKVAELRAQLAEMRGRPTAERANYEELVQDIREHITESQQAEFDAISKRFLARANGPERPDAGLRRMQRAIRRVDMTPEQKESVRVIFAEALQNSREKAGDPDAMQQLEQGVRDKIHEQLDEEQVAQFDQAVAEMEQQEARMADRMGRAGRHSPVVRPPSTDPNVPPAATPAPDGEQADQGNSEADGQPPADDGDDDQ